MADLSLRAHGGWCCGMAHIHGFKNTPNSIESATSLINQTAGYAYQYNVARDVEKSVDRLDALIAYHKTHNCRAGIIEVVLNCNQWPNWEETLLVRGFKVVNEFVNSNTGCTIRVYHLYTADYTPPKAK